MAGQELVQFRVDGDLKKEAGDIFKELGLDIPTACRMFLAKSKAVRGIPFEMTPPAKEERTRDASAAFMRMREQVAQAGVPEMSLDEINDEIREARKSLKAKKAGGR